MDTCEQVPNKYQEAVKRCIETGEYIKKEDLKHGSAYAVRARNFDVAIWDGEKFQGLRFKFGDWYMDDEKHWDEGAPFGTVKPLYELE